MSRVMDVAMQSICEGRPRSRFMVLLQATLLSLGLVGATACDDEDAAETTTGGMMMDDPPAIDPQHPIDGYVELSPQHYLHYLDFGGAGETIILLAGMGNSAQIYRPFAPYLTDDYRVVALTRRGFLPSSRPEEGYDFANLATDIMRLMDHLGLARAHIAGHSVAGQEMNSFAVLYPQRLGKLVYLDAAFDYTGGGMMDEMMGGMTGGMMGGETGGEDLPDVPPPWAMPPRPTEEQLASVAGYAEYLAWIEGVRFPLSELEQSLVLDADGRVTGSANPLWLGEAIMASVQSPNYPAIAAPSLAIYAEPLNVDDMMPWLQPGSPEWMMASQFLPLFATQGLEMRARFDREVPVSTVVDLGGASHWVFLSEPELVAGMVVAFLDTPE